jgi:hypothetical protein
MHALAPAAAPVRRGVVARTGNGATSPACRRGDHDSSRRRHTPRARGKERRRFTGSDSIAGGAVFNFFDTVLCVNGAVVGNDARGLEPVTRARTRPVSRGPPSR